MTDQSKLALLSDSPTASITGAAGTTMAFAEGGTVEPEEDGPWNEYKTAEPNSNEEPEHDDDDNQEPGPWDDYKDRSSAMGALARGTIKGALPAAGAISAGTAGAEVGAALGALGGPAAPVTVPLGALAGGLGGAYLGGKAVGDVQDWFLDKLGLSNHEQDAADEAQHPYARMAGSLVPNLLAFNPAGAASATSRLLTAGIGGGVEAAQEKSAGSDFDVGKIALAAGAMALMHKPTDIGRGLMAPGELASSTVVSRLPLATQAAINAGKKRAGDFWSGVATQGQPGRPDMAPSEERPGEPEGPDGTLTQQQPAQGEADVTSAANTPETTNPDVTQPMPAPADNVATENVAGGTQPGLSPSDNIALPPDNSAVAATEKTPEFVAQSKAEAAPARNMNSTLGTAHEQAKPNTTLATVGSNPDHPIGVGSERDYRATADSNVHPSSSGSGQRPTATMGDPARANMSPEIELAMTGKDPTKTQNPLGDQQGTENLRPAVDQLKQTILNGGGDDDIAAVHTQHKLGFEQARQARQQAEHELTAPDHRQPIGPEIPPIPDTGMGKAAVTDTVTKLRKNGFERLAKAVETNPATEPQARHILRAAGTEDEWNGGLVDEAKLRQARRILERATDPKDIKSAEQLLEEARDPAAQARREAQAAQDAELRATRRENEGQVAKLSEGETVTASSQRKAALIKRAADAAQKAFDTFGPRNDISLPDRLRSALALAQEENLGQSPNYTPKSKGMRVGENGLEEGVSVKPTRRRASKSDTPAMQWLRAAEDLVGTAENPKTPTATQTMKFLSDERLMRADKESARLATDTNKIESGIKNNKRPVATDAHEAAVNDWKNSLSDEDRLKWENEFSPSEEDAMSGFFSNEDGSLNPRKFLASLRGIMGKKAQGDARRYNAKAEGSWRAEYARSVDDHLAQVRKQDDTNWLDRELEAAKQPQILKDNADKVYMARERDDIASLPADVRDAYYKHLDHVFEDNDHLYDQIHTIDPTLLGEKVASHVSRIPKGVHPDFGGDPVVNVMAARRRGLKLSASQTMQREFMVVEDPQGKRTVVSPTNDGYREWNKYQSTLKTNASFEPKPGTTFKDANGNLMTVKDALTPEIEANATFKNGKPAEYYKNAVMSAYITNAELRGILSHLQYLESLKPELMARKLGTTDAKQAREWAAEGTPWEKTVMPQMKNWYMTPRVREVFDDFASPGLTTNSAWDKVRALSEKVTKMLFLNPIFHIANVGTHWFTARGWDWMPGSGGYKRMFIGRERTLADGRKQLALNGIDAIRSVLSQDSAIMNSPFGKYLGINSPEYRRFQDVIREHAGGTQFGGVLNQNRWHSIAKAAGETVASNPSKWDPIARIVGMSAGDLGRAIYRNSSKIMWAANDVFHTMLVMERLQKGMTMHDAVVDTEKHFPNYRVPSRVISDGEWGRFTSQMLRDNTLFAFGPYHSGVFNSYAHIVKDAIHPDSTKEERWDAAGHMFALGILAFAVYPALDKMAQLVTGNKHAEQRRRGPLTLPTHIVRAMQGKEDLLNVGPSGTVTLSPLVGGTLDLYKNRDFAGRPYVEPGDVSKALKGSPKAMGRVAVQGAAAAAKTYVAPYAMAGKALENKSGGVMGGIRDQAMDIKNPSQAAIKYEQQAALLKQRAAEARARKGNRNFEENVYNRLTR